jgi:peptidoglycan hydrolase CwlO-like protein
MKKTLALVLLAIVVIGCGPKMATKETMDALAEARAALEAAEAKIEEMTEEKGALEAMMADLTADIEKLEGDIDMLQNKINTRCKGRVK